MLLVLTRERKGALGSTVKLSPCPTAVSEGHKNYCLLQVTLSAIVFVDRNRLNNEVLDAEFLLASPEMTRI